MTPGKKILYYREFLGFSLSEVADATGVPIERLASIELERDIPSDNDLASLGRLFQLRPEVFCDGVDPIAEARAASASASMLDSLPQSDQDQVGKFLDYLGLTNSGDR